jgi:hypothetical protein
MAYMTVANANDKHESAHNGNGHCVFIVHRNGHVCLDVNADKDECRRYLERAEHIARRRARRRQGGSGALLNTETRMRWWNPFEAHLWREGECRERVWDTHTVMVHTVTHKHTTSDSSLWELCAKIRDLLISVLKTR